MIPDALVQATWQEVARFRDSRIRKEMAHLGKRHKDLLFFVVRETEELSSQAHELAVYLFFVVIRMFEKGGPLARTSLAAIDEQFQNNIGELEKLVSVDDPFIERVAAGQASQQPHVLRYILEALMAEGDGPDEVELTEDELGALFLVLKTVVDVLDGALELPS